MPPLSERKKFDTSTHTGQANADGTDLLVISADDGGFVSHVDLSVDEVVTWNLIARHDTDGDTVIASWEGDEIERGSFEEPVAEFGPDNDIVIDADDPAGDISANVTIDEYKR